MAKEGGVTQWFKWVHCLNTVLSYKSDLIDKTANLNGRTSNLYLCVEQTEKVLHEIVIDHNTLRPTNSAIPLATLKCFEM